MSKKKKRLQMQKTRTAEEKLVQKALADGVGLGLFDQVGFDKHGEPIYKMKLDFEKRLEHLKKTLGLSTPDFSA